MEINDDYLTAEQEKTLVEGEARIRAAVRKLAGAKLQADLADYHATMLAELWESARKVTFYVENLASQQELVVTLEGDTVESIKGHDFTVEMQGELDHLKMHVETVKNETLKGLSKAFRWTKKP